MNTYLYEVTYKKNNKQNYCNIRAAGKEYAIQKIFNMYGEIEIISVSRIGN